MAYITKDWTYVPELTDTEDDKLYLIYKQGWHDCSDDSKARSTDRSKNFEGIYKTAYNHGWFHYIAGDDQPSIDALTREQILDQIKHLGA